MPVGVDTGFFFSLEELHPLAVDVWNNEEIITCSLVLFELQRRLLKGEFSNWTSIIDDIERSVDIIPVSVDIAKKASHIAHGTGMPAIDSLILSALLEANCREIYTRDEDLELYKNKSVSIINLRKV